MSLSRIPGEPAGDHGNVERQAESDSWKQELYDVYISSGHTPTPSDSDRGLRAGDYPYFRRVIATLVPPDRTIAVADLGCGHGTLLHCLKDAGYSNVCGVDSSPEQVELAHRLGVREVQLGDILPFLEPHEAKFDVIFLMDILEHVATPVTLQILRAAHRALKVGGKVIVHVPNAEGVFGMRVRYGDLTHATCFTPRSIRQAFSLAGFRQASVLEDHPIPASIMSWTRAQMWRLLTLYHRLLLTAESGRHEYILSQNMLAWARK